VLTRRLQMAIPDEVAQYAEGRRIVSYFALAQVQDEDRKKETWLWTTTGGGPQPFDFDSFRVFVWSLRRHRYETAYIERNLKGYAPVMLENVELSTGMKAGGQATVAKYPGFSICMEKSDGQKHRREYALLGNIVRYAGERPCETIPPLIELAKVPATGSSVAAPEAPQPSTPPKQAESFGRRFKERLQSLWHSWFKR
jgi:hypothetical protein